MVIFLPSAQDEVPARDRKARATLPIVGCVHANYSTLSLDPYWWNCAPAWRKKNLQLDGGLQRRRAFSEGPQCSDADVTREAYALMLRVSRVLPEKLHRDSEPVAIVFSTLQALTRSHGNNRRLRGGTRLLAFDEMTRVVYRSNKDAARGQTPPHG
jgi:hypothetical protein